MRSKYACFISYRRGEGGILKGFMEEFVRRLTDYLELYFDDQGIFLDEEEIQGGEVIESKLAQALCKSACMILVYIPKYFSDKKTWCTREYLAMCEIQKHRLSSESNNCSAKTLIIPIILRKDPKIPSDIQNIKYYDFSTFGASFKKYFNQKETLTKVQEIADIIVQYVTQFQEHCTCDYCQQFKLPSEDQAIEWLKQYEDPQKFPRL